jgi:hypothetical protein
LTSGYAPNPEALGQRQRQPLRRRELRIAQEDHDLLEWGGAYRQDRLRHQPLGDRRRASRR